MFNLMQISALVLIAALNVGAGWQDYRTGKIRHFWRLFGIAVAGYAVAVGFPVQGWFFGVSCALFMLMFRLNVVRGGDGVFVLNSLFHPLGFVPVMAAAVFLGIFGKLWHDDWGHYNGEAIGFQVMCASMFLFTTMLLGW